MTPHNENNPQNDPVDFTRFWPSYRYHLLQECSRIRGVDLGLGVVLVVVGGMLAEAAYTNQSFLGAVAVGAAMLHLAHGITRVLMFALEDTVAARPWYGVGRTLRHRDLGECTVLDTDHHGDQVWALIRSKTDETAIAWVRVQEFDEVVVITRET